MLKKCLFAALISISLDAASYLPLTGEEEQAFQIQVNAAIEKAEQRVKELKNTATRKDLMPTWNSKLELQNAIIQLDVKKTLAGNFQNSESLRSLAVRQALLQILNKAQISTGDLAEFQSLVQDEKSKIRSLENTPR